MKFTEYLHDNEYMESLFRSKTLSYESHYNINELIEKTKQLNDLDFDIGKNKSVAVVGNSGMLMEKEYGKLIDSHDYVFRCNLGRVDGFEKNVGSNTSFRFVAGKSFWYTTLKNQYSEFDNDFFTNLENQRLIIKANPLYDSIQGIIKHYDTKSKIHFLKQDFVNEIEDLSDVDSSTLGFIAICVAVQFFTKISIFGFGFFKESWDNRHYFEKVTPYSGAHAQHKKDEENYINFLEKNEMIGIYR